jgi:phage recombination protein Bet
MSNVVTIPNASAADFTPRDLALIRRTVASDTNDDEFNLFISYCRALRLDPRRRQIYALVYNKGKAQKRKMSIIVAIDGFRSIAARSGCYRPDDEEPRFEYDEAAKSPTNPLGLVKATVKVWQHSHGQWFPVTASAYWDEYAPIKSEWGESEDGCRAPTGKKTLDGKWPQMPRLMLAKVAEALALRKAWPDDFANVYASEEMDRATVIEADPSQAAALGAEEERRAKIGAGGRAIMVDWLDNKPLDSVPVGQFADRVCDFIARHKDEPSQILQFGERNRHGLREFWAASPGDALELKKRMELAVKEVEQAE